MIPLVQEGSEGDGFRNRDLQGCLYDQPAESLQEKRRRSARVSRLLRMLRAHGLIKKVSATHRYVLTSGGSDILRAILATQSVTLDQLQAATAQLLGRKLAAES